MKADANLKRCGIFVRNGKRVQLNFYSDLIPNTVDSRLFKTFGKALKAAKLLGFKEFVPIVTGKQIGRAHV